MAIDPRTRVPRWTPPFLTALRLTWRPALVFNVFSILGWLALMATAILYKDADDAFEMFVALCMGTLGVNNLYSQGNPVLVLGIEHARHIAAAGWSKQDVQRALFERARQPWGLVKNRGKSKGPRFPEFVDRSDDHSMVPIIREPRDLITIVGGGAGGKSMFLPTAGGQSLAVSKPVETAASPGKRVIAGLACRQKRNLFRGGRS